MDITIVVADDLTLVREGLAALCGQRPGFQVVGQCKDGLETVEAVARLRPLIALVDIGLPKLHISELVRKIREMPGPTRAIIMSARGDRKLVMEALRTGASGFILKSGPARHLHDALSQVAQGGIYVSPMLELTHIFLNSGKKEPEDPLEALSSREYQVFSLLIEGVRAKEIAARLELSPKTVDTYRASLMRKLDIHDVAGLVKFAIQRDLT